MDELMRQCWESGDHRRGWELYRQGGDGAEYHLYGARFAWGLRLLHAAQRCAEAGLRARPPAELRRLLRISLGITSRELGDTYRAMEMLEPLLREKLRPDVEAYVTYNLALVCEMRRQHEESVRHNLRAAALFALQNCTDSHRKAVQNAAWSLCRLGRPGEAADLLDSLDSMQFTGEAYLHQVLGRAYVLMVEGLHMQDVAELCGEIFEAADRGEQVGYDLLAQAAWIGGRAGLMLGHHERAVRLAAVALHYATEARDARLMNDATRLSQEALGIRSA